MVKHVKWEEQKEEEMHEEISFDDIDAANNGLRESRITFQVENEKRTIVSKVPEA